MTAEYNSDDKIVGVNDSIQVKILSLSFGSPLNYTQILRNLNPHYNNFHSIFAINQILKKCTITTF